MNEIVSWDITNNENKLANQLTNEMQNNENILSWDVKNNNEELNTDKEINTISKNKNIVSWDISSQPIEETKSSKEFNT